MYFSRSANRKMKCIAYLYTSLIHEEWKQGSQNHLLCPNSNPERDIITPVTLMTE